MKKSIILTALAITACGALQGSPIKDTDASYVFIVNDSKNPLMMRTFAIDRNKSYPARNVTSKQVYIEDDMDGYAYVIESSNQRIGIMFDKDKWVYYELPKTKAIGSLSYDDMKIKNKKSTEKNVRVAKGASNSDFLVASITDNNITIKLASGDDVVKIKGIKPGSKSMNMSAEMKAQGVDFS
jgi:hypothetical protein